MNTKILLLGLLGLGSTCYGAVTITTPTVNTGELIRAGDWNKIRADLVSLSSTLDILGNQAWQSSGSDMYYLNGRVGAGIALPPAQLSVYKPTPSANEAMFQIGQDADDNKFKIDEDGDTQMDGTLLVRGGTVYDSSGSLELNGEDNVYVSMDWNDNDNDNRAFIIGKNDAGPGDDWVELMRVEEDGDLTLEKNAYIGNNNAGLLQIKGGSGTSSQVIFSDGGTSQARVGVPTGQTYLSLSGSNTLTPDVVILEDGNVGVGTTNPSTKLHSSNGGFHNLRLTNPLPGGSSWDFGLGDNGLGMPGDLSIGYIGSSGGGIGGGDHYSVINLQNDGNVGIGTTAPEQKLTVNGRIRSLADGASGYVASGIHLMSHNNYRGAGTFSYGQNADWFWGNPYTDHAGAFIIARSGASGGTSDAVAQYSNATVIVTSNDRVGINTIVPQTTLDVTGGFMQTRYNKGNATVCYYTHSSSKVSFGPCSSSRRYKENISELSVGLDEIDLLRPVKFDWKKDQKTDFGLIAEEVAETIPNLAIYGENGEVESVNYQSLTAILTKAIQELKTEKDAEIESLRARLEVLEAAQ